MSETEAILRNLIEKIAAEHNFVDYDIKIEPVSSGGANYSSTLSAITITEGNNTLNLFAKTGTMGDKMRGDMPNVYHNEMFVYTKLSKVYKDLEDRFKVPQEHRLILSKFYGFNPTLYEEILVLENLVAEGYQSFDRFKSIDWEYAVSAMTNLAKLHALSCAYSELYPNDFEKVINIDLKSLWSIENGPIAEYYKIASQRAVGVVEEKYRKKMERFFEKFGAPKFIEFFSPSRKPVLIHGDFRPSNLMHKIRDVSKLCSKLFLFVDVILRAVAVATAVLAAEFHSQFGRKVLFAKNCS